MTRSWIGALLIAATALTPIAASAQDGGFGTRIVREAQRGGGERQAPRQRSNPDAPRGRAAPEQTIPNPQPDRAQYQRSEGRRGGDGAGQGRRGGGDGQARRGGDGQGRRDGGWQGRGGGRAAPAPVDAGAQPD